MVVSIPSRSGRVAGRSGNSGKFVDIPTGAVARTA